MSAPNWKHDDLLADLASFLNGNDRMIWTDMQLGPSGSPRPDVYVLHRSYSKPRPLAFEIKISRSDLRSDTTSGKWESYLKYAGGVVFAVPDGLCTVADIPASCGLIVRKAATWRYVRKPTIQSVTLPMDAVMKLLMDGVSRAHSARLAEPRSVKLWEDHDTVRRKFGDAVARAAKDIVNAEQYLAHVNAQSDKEKARRDAAYRAAVQKGCDEAAKSDELRGELCAVLGLNADAAIWEVRRAIESARKAVSADSRVQDVEYKLSLATANLRNALSQLETAA